MARPAGAFRAETAGSLTPELEGTFKSISHPRRGEPAKDKQAGAAGRDRHGSR